MIGADRCVRNIRFSLAVQAQRLSMTKLRMLSISAVAAAALSALAVAAAPGAPKSQGPSRADLALLSGVIQLVERDYVQTVEPHELTKEALKGMLNRLDPHSDYMDEQEFRLARSDIAGKFGGLGIQISQQNGVPKIISPIDGTPAARAGLQPGDLIVAVDGSSTHGTSLTKIVRVLRGSPGSKVKLTIARGTETPFDVTITRAIIEVDTVKSKMLPDGIGYVRITRFGDDTPKDFRQALAGLKKEASSLKGLVLDLRNDPGGLLSAAVDVTSEFLSSGTVVTIKGRRGSDNHEFKVNNSGLTLPDTPMVVLINGASASASEIVAGALQDRKRATVMGTQSFGKGSVQTIIPLNGHGAVRLTTALYYTPGGRSIQGQGIKPDIIVDVPKEQQVAGGVLLRESALSGAFQNPGSLEKTSPAENNSSDDKAETIGDRTIYAPPIKTELIGTDDDAQLKAAIAHLRGESVRTTGDAN
jgi:carboxyl-terminal processing protease